MSIENDFLHPEQCFEVIINGKKTKLHEGYDVIHRFEKLGFNLLKYYDQDERTMLNIVIEDVPAVALHSRCGIEVLQRRGITPHEYDIYQEWVAMKLDDIFAGEFEEEPPTSD